MSRPRKTWEQLARLAEVFGEGEGRLATERARRARLRLRDWTGMGAGVGRFKRPGDFNLSFTNDAGWVTFVTRDYVLRDALGPPPRAK